MENELLEEVIADIVETAAPVVSSEPLSDMASGAEQVVVNIDTESIVNALTYIQGFLLFIVVVILLYFTYKFFRLFF